MRTIHYFSPWLKSLKKYQSAWVQIEAALTAENEIYDFVPNAADIVTCIWVDVSPDMARHVPTFATVLQSVAGARGGTPHYRTSVGTWRATSREISYT